MLDIEITNQKIDFFDNNIRTPVSDSGFAEKAVYAAECALKRTSERCVDDAVRLSVMNIVKAMPVVGAVISHRQ